MRKTQEKKGITLISLVITIIVLLILAAVAITLAVDSDGLFTKAGDAANKWNTSVGSEQTTLQNLLDMADEILQESCILIMRILTVVTWAMILMKMQQDKHIVQIQVTENQQL